jgi:hypothetical protein
LSAKCYKNGGRSQVKLSYVKLLMLIARGKAWFCAKPKETIVAIKLAQWGCSNKFGCKRA